MEKLLTTDEEILKYYGWEIECESPFEVRNVDGYNPEVVGSSPAPATKKYEKYL